MKKISIFKILMLLVFVSCSDEPVELLNNPDSSTKIKASLVDGILHFKSTEDFKTSIEYLKSLEDEQVETIMYSFYNDGFEPLYPFYKDEDKVNIDKFIAKKIKRSRPIGYIKKTKGNAYVESDDNLISDDYFAAFLNFDREIVVDGKLHKFTNKGVFVVSSSLKDDLDTYIADNNISEDYVDPNTLERGLMQVSATVERYAPAYISSNCNVAYSIAPNESYGAFYDDFVIDDCGNWSGGSSGSSSGTTTTPDYTESMKNYMKDLEPCDLQNGGIFGWTPFGTSKKCYSSHNADNRVKTKYWNEDYKFYNSIGVKVKHQKKGLWWHAKKTDEVALVINQALFVKTYPNQIPNYNALPTSSSNNQRLYYYNDKFYDNLDTSYYVATGWTPTNDDLVPVTPFADDIIVQEYIDLPILRNIDDIEIEAKEINKLFWDQGVWDGIKKLMSHFNDTPKKMTYILTTPQKVYVNYIDLTQRQLNVKKIVNTLDYDWGGEIKLSWGINENGDWTSNIIDWKKPLTYFKAFHFTELTDFDTVSMDFVGMTRLDNEWKGSRLVYQKNQ